MAILSRLQSWSYVFPYGSERALLICRRLYLKIFRNLRFVPPNYAFLENFQPGDRVVDVGCGDNPDFSLHMLQHYAVECFAVDPTRKHGPALSFLAKERPRFHYLPLALGAECGTQVFYESQANVSGSFLRNHRNIKSDPITSYEVEMVTMTRLLEMIRQDSVALLKMDIEGMEYKVIPSLDEAAVRRFRQILVEFHHYTVEGVEWPATRDAISHLRRLGMKACVYNGRDCLFYW